MFVYRLLKSKISSDIKLIPLLTVLLEILAVYPWLYWFGQWVKWSEFKPHMNFISYIILTVFVEVISYAAQKNKWSVKRLRLVVFPTAIVLWLVLFRWSCGGGYGIFDTGWFGYVNTHVFQATIAGLSGLYFIWRGISISRQSNLFEDLYRQFIIGLVFIILLLLAWAFSGLQQNGIWSTVGIYGLSYFTVGLLILALANVNSLSSIFARHQETVGAFRRRWLSMMLVLIVIILIIAVALGSVFYTNMAATVFHVLGQLGEWLLIAITWIFWPAAFVVTILVYVSQWLINLFTHGKEPEVMKINLMEVARDIQDKDRQSSHLPPVLITTLKWTVVSLVIAVAIYFIGRTLMRYWQSKTEEGVEEETASLWSWNVFKADLRNFLAWLFSWLHRRKKAAVPEVSPGKYETFDISSGKELNMRELYRVLLRRGQLIGLPRHKSETANEYSSRLGGKRPAAVDDLDLLTEAYVAERYGDTPAGAEKKTFFNRLWASLNAKLLGGSANK